MQADVRIVCEYVTTLDPVPTCMIYVSCSVTYPSLKKLQQTFLKDIRVETRFMLDRHYIHSVLNQATILLFSIDHIHAIL